MSESLYGPMVAILAHRFGVEFALTDTGGGCTALVGEFTDDLKVYLTDAPSSPNGQECQITNTPTRLRLGESTVGFAVGVYHDEGQTQVAYAEYPTATTTALPEIVSEQLLEADPLFDYSVRAVVPAAAGQRTASYLVESHPDAEPLDLSQLYVTFTVCDVCGALVHDDLLHGTWHDRSNA
jgi:hypothetical protein